MYMCIYIYIYIYVYIYICYHETMYPPGYHHNGVIATHSLGYMMYGYT